MKKIGLPLIIFICSFILFGYFSQFNIDTHHDGLVLKPAFDILEGKILFRDSFSQYGLLFHFINAVALKTIGKYLVVVRLLTVTFYSGISVLIWLINKKFLSPHYSVLLIIFWTSLAPIFTLDFHSWASVYALFFQLLSLYFGLIYVSKHKLRYVILMGVTTALTFWNRFPVGTLLLLCYILYFFYHFFTTKQKKIVKEISLLLLGFLIISIPCIVYLVVFQAFYDWWLQTISLGPSFAQTIRGTSADQIIKSLLLTRYIKDGTYLYQLIWLVIPFSTIYMAIRCLTGTKKVLLQQQSYNNEFLLISLVGLSSWFQYYPTVDHRHFYWASGPMIGSYFVLLTQTIAKQKIQFQKLLKIGFTTVITTFFVFQVMIGVKYYSNNKYLLNKPDFLKYIKVTQNEQFFYQNNVDTLTALFELLPDKTYVNHSGDALISLLDKHYYTVHKLYVNWSFVKTSIYPEFDHVMNSYISENKPLLFTTTPKLFPNYCDMQIISNQGNPIRLLISEEDWEKIKLRWYQKIKMNKNLRNSSCF